MQLGNGRRSPSIPGRTALVRSVTVPLMAPVMEPIVWPAPVECVQREAGQERDERARCAGDRREEVARIEVMRRPWQKGPATSAKPAEFRLRHDESEPGPTARLDRSLEPPARLRLVAPQEDQSPRP